MKPLSLDIRTQCNMDSAPLDMSPDPFGRESSPHIYLFISNCDY